MKCTYINLDSAAERRLLTEDNFRKFGATGWQLERFAALDKAFVAQQGIPGTLQPGEKGCFLSHRAVIRDNLDAGAPILVMEDDAVWCDVTCSTIDNFLQVSDRYDWDIIFTDVCLPAVHDMVELVRLRHQLSDAQEVKLLDLSKRAFAGSTSYIVNHHSLAKIDAILHSVEGLDIPYDLFLRHLIWNKHLKGLMFFPFITSVSELSSASQIQQANTTDTVWNAFRQLAWVGRDFNAIAPTLEMINRDLCDDESRLFGVIFAAMVSRGFQIK